MVRGLVVQCPAKAGVRRWSEQWPVRAGGSGITSAVRAEPG